MKSTIITFIAGLWLMNLAMGQTPCSVSGGTVMGGYSEICVGTTTGIMELKNYLGTVDYWEYSINSGSTWNPIYSASTDQYSDVLTQTGTYLYRVNLYCTYYDANNNLVTLTSTSSTKTVTVKNANGGTITTGGGTLCTGGSPVTLTATGIFGGVPQGNMYWEYSTNGGSSYSIDGLGTNTNPYTPNLSALGGYGHLYVSYKSCLW